MASESEIEMKPCKDCKAPTPHIKFRPGDRPGFYWKCLCCGRAAIDGDGNEPVVAK